MLLLLLLGHGLALKDAKFGLMDSGNHILHLANRLLIVFQAILDVLLGDQKTLPAVMDILFYMHLLSLVLLQLGAERFYLFLQVKGLDLLLQLLDLRSQLGAYYLYLMLKLLVDHRLLIGKRVDLIHPFL